MMLLITQGSQAIQLIREMYSIGYRPSDLFVITTDERENESFKEFLSYYEIEYLIANSKNFNDQLSKLNPEFVISFSNPFIVSKENLLNAKYINFHPGILPYYKGSLSTVYSLINNEKYVGGTWHWMDEKVDCGPIIDKFKIEIDSSDTAFTLHHKIFKIAIDKLESILIKARSGFGIEQETDGKFYYNQFPDISNLSTDLQKRINYFPPKFT